MPDLVNIVRVELLHPLQQPQRMEIARARPHGEIERGHGFQIMVEHVGPRRDHLLERAFLAQEIGGEHLDGGARTASRGWRGWSSAKVPRAAVGEIVAVDRGDDDVGKPELGGRLRDMLRLMPDRARPAARS